MTTSLAKIVSRRLGHMGIPLVGLGFGQGQAWVRITAQRDFLSLAARIGGVASRSVDWDYFPPATSFWNLGFLRSGSKLGSILSQPGERSEGIFNSGSS